VQQPEQRRSTFKLRAPNFHFFAIYVWYREQEIAELDLS
jgi:hypothetical protein